MEHLEMAAANYEQRCCLLQNGYASVNRSVRRTNWNEAVEMEQLVNEGTMSVWNCQRHSCLKTQDNEYEGNEGF